MQGFSFVFCDSGPKKKDIDSAIDEISRLEHPGLAEKASIRGKPKLTPFTNWHRKTGVGKLRERVICVYLGPRKSKVTLHQVKERFDVGKKCHFFCERLEEFDGMVELPSPVNLEFGLLRTLCNDAKKEFQPRKKGIERIISPSELASLVRPKIVSQHQN